MGFVDSRYVEAVDLIQMLEQGKRGKKDKRRANRIEIRVKLNIRLMVDDKLSAPYKVELRDLSPRGLRLIVPDLMEGGSSFVIRLPGKPTAPPSVPLICRVVHCTPQRDGTFSVGCEFTGRLPDTSSTAKADEAETLRISNSILG
jgi:hypothetical protein